MDLSVIFQFLRDIAVNNNREWFEEHRGEYDNARRQFENFLSAVIGRISLFDETVKDLQTKK